MKMKNMNIPASALPCFDWARSHFENLRWGIFCSLIGWFAQEERRGSWSAVSDITGHTLCTSFLLVNTNQEYSLAIITETRTKNYEAIICRAIIVLYCGQGWLLLWYFICLFLWFILWLTFIFTSQRWTALKTIMYSNKLYFEKNVQTLPGQTVLALFVPGQTLLNSLLTTYHVKKY